MHLFRQFSVSCEDGYSFPGVLFQLFFLAFVVIISSNCEELKITLPVIYYYWRLLMRIQCVKLYSVLTIPLAALFMFYLFFQNSPHPLLRHSLRMRVCKLYQVQNTKTVPAPRSPTLFSLQVQVGFLLPI